jgi:hypothetical protein
VLAVAVIAFILGVRTKDLPEPEPPSPFSHLDERKAAIYDNLRDLQFEFRVGKLSEQDYQNTKMDLQKELAAVLAETDRLKQQLGGVKEARSAVAPDPKPVPASAVPKDQIGYQCPSCGASFETNLKFCGECGKPMQAVKA